MTAHRNLAQRIDSLLQAIAAGKADPTPWQLDQVRKALDDLEERRFDDGERAISRGGRPQIYEPKRWMGEVPDVKRLAERLAELRSRVA